MEQVLDWLNENELRAYPLLDSYDKLVTLGQNTVVLPDNFILDLQLIATHSLVNPAGETVPVYLKSLKYSEPQLDITFGTTDTTTTVFTIPSTVSAVFPLYVRNADGNLAVFGAGVNYFLSFCGSTDFEVFTDIYVEPSTVTQFNDAWLGVNKLTVSPEKISKNAFEVGAAHSYEPALPLLDMPEQTELQGDIKFLEGYNFRVDTSTGQINLEIGYNFGLKMNCTTSFIPPEYLDCGELVSYINGVPPDADGNFKLNPGTNIDIVSGNTLDLFKDPLTETANTHTLFVGLTFKSTDLCAPVNIVPSLI